MAFKFRNRQVKLTDCQQNWEQLEQELSAPGAVLLQTATQAVATATFTTVTFDTVLYETGHITTDLSADSITIRKSGVYLVAGQVFFPTVGAGVPVVVEVFLNGASSNRMPRSDDYGAFDDSSVGVSLPVKLAAGDVITLKAYQNSGANVNIGYATANSVQCKLGCHWLGPA